MFKAPNVPEGTYGTWDDKGIPLTDGQGQEIGKSKSKKLSREWEEQGKRHEAWLAHLAQQEGPST
jgi:cysteinyl-tRNA synthetase